MDEKKITLLRELLLEAASEIEALEKQRDEIDARIEKLHSAAFADFYDKQHEEESTAVEELEEPSKPETQEEIVIDYLKNHPGATRSQMVDADVLHTSNTLQRMRRNDLIEAKGTGKGARWFVV